MRFKSWALPLIGLCASVLLTACGGGGSKDSGSNTQIRLVNASPSYATLDLSVDSKTINSAVAYGTAGSYGTVNTGATGTQILNNVGSAVAQLTPSLAADVNYSLIAYGSAGSVRTALLQESEAAPDSAKSKLLAMNLAPDAGSLDIYVTLPADDLTNASPIVSNLSATPGSNTSSYNLLNAGNFRIRVTGAGNKNDLRLDVSSLALPAGGVSTLILTSTDGGVLVNGIHLVQKGTVSKQFNTTARTRLVAAVGEGASVSSQWGNTVLMPQGSAPAIGDYTSIQAAAAGTLSIKVNGTDMTLTTPTLAAGKDYTLLLWGPASAPVLKVLEDDNRLPTNANQAKMRLINGVANSTNGLTLSVDYSPLATNVQAGTTSSPVAVNASASSFLSVNTPTLVSPVFSVTGLPVTAGGVYTVFMMGTNNTMVGSLRRER